MPMKYVRYLTLTKLILLIHQKVWTLSPDPFRREAYTIDKCHSNKDLNFEVGEVISNRHICRKKSSYIHFFEICGLHKNGSSACQYILKDIFKFKVVLKLLRHLEKLNVPKFKKWLEGSRQLKSSSWKLQLIANDLVLVHATSLYTTTHSRQI